MNIDPKNHTISCDCGQTSAIKDTKLHHCSDCQSYHFICDRCKIEETISVFFNDYLTTELSKHVLPANGKFDNSSDNDFADIFLGQNQVPLTDELIARLVKEKGMDKEELLYMQKEGAQYSISRDSFIFPLEGSFDSSL